MITRRDFLKVTGVAAAAAALTACGGSSSTASSAAASGSVASSAAAKLDKIKVAVPNDTTNEARALTLLEKNGFFKLKADAGLTATKNDIEENPLNVTVDEVEAAQVPNVLQDEDYAVINSNYAISAGLNPMTDALAMEDGSSAYVNILVCKDGNQEEPKIKALAAALQSQKVKDFMDETYKGSVVSVVENPTDGYDSTVDYDALNGQTVSCAATPAPPLRGAGGVQGDPCRQGHHAGHPGVRRLCDPQPDRRGRSGRHQLLPASAVSGQLQRRKGYPSGICCRYSRRAHGRLRRQAGQSGTHRGIIYHRGIS